MNSEQEIDIIIKSRAKMLPRKSKCALIKAAVYIINADGKIIETEKEALLKVLTCLNADESMLQEAVNMTDSDMFLNINSQLAYLAAGSLLVEVAQSGDSIDKYGKGFQTLNAILNRSQYGLSNKPFWMK